MSGHADVLWRNSQRFGSEPEIRIRLLGMFTMDTLVPHLGIALDALGIRAAITVGPFNQIVQECADPHSETTRLAPDILVIWARLEQLRHGAMEQSPGVAAGGIPADPLDDIATAAMSAARRTGSRLIVVLPATPAGRPLGAGDASSRFGTVATAAAVRERLRSRLIDETGAVVCDADDLLRMVGELAAYDRRLDLLAGIPYSSKFLAAAGDALARAVRLAIRPARKVVVLDADGTLWGGAVGELGADGVDLGPGSGAAYLDFQRFLVRLQSTGTLLALCSKNEAEDVWAVFRRQDMRLRPEHFSAWRLGWKSKSESIVELATELNVGVDAMLLIDDNAAELAEVRAMLPCLATLLMPADPVLWQEMLSSEAFDKLPPTEDDTARPRRVADDRHREVLRQTVTPEAHLENLDIRASGKYPERADHRRLAQLVLKTNQMNLNGLRFSEPDLVRLCEDREHMVRMFAVSDRFGDYGQVGAYVLAFDGQSARLVLFLVSCRALGARRRADDDCRRVRERGAAGCGPNHRQGQSNAAQRAGSNVLRNARLRAT